MKTLFGAVAVALFLGLVILPSASLSAAAVVADHTTISKFNQIPTSYFGQIRSNYSYFYGHTSHGSQIMTGLSMLEGENPTLYEIPTVSEYGSDLGYDWVGPTQDYLNTHPECNFVMWSWCGQVSSSTQASINEYLEAMNGMEEIYPNVKFVYMTGHLDGSGPTGNLYVRNNQIRSWCSTHGKILFDFADIESYDPEAVYYPDGSDACEWCYTWCASHTCPDCSGGCAHSHCFNCYQKGKAWWWMMARVAGWNPEPATCGDANGDSGIDVSDAVFLIAYIFSGGPAPSPMAYGDVNCDSAIDISDAVYLISYIFSGGSAPCAGC
jgi:hypothetical protein